MPEELWLIPRRSQLCGKMSGEMQNKEMKRMEQFFPFQREIDYDFDGGEMGGVN